MISTFPVFALTPTQAAKLLASDGAGGDQFGYSVSVSGDTAVIGAVFDDDIGTNSGSAYVFVRAGASWTQQAKLLASDGAGGDSFGRSVSVSGDTVVIGADADDDTGFNSGSAYVFVRTGATWTQQAKLLASDGAGGDEFGFSVSVSGDTAVIGAHNDDDKGTTSGSAYVFVRAGASWTQQAKLLASDGAGGDSFGWSVSVSGDTAVIGALFDDDTGSSSGSAYVFVRDGASWTQQAKLLASDGAGGDSFGRSVSVSGDTAVIGAHNDDDNESDSGSAYVFVRAGASWAQQAKLLASDGAELDFFGRSVSVSGDTAVIGASFDDDNGSDSGSAYVFVRAGASWTQQAKLLASDGAGGDSFGRSVSVSGDTAVIGALFDNNNGTFSGSAYVFELQGSDTDGDGVLNPSDNCPNDANSDQADNDGDGVGDVCDPDDDNDGVADSAPDNCPFTANPDQFDADGDGAGDACDEDLDGDTVPNGLDNCPADPNPGQEDYDVDGLGDACDPDDDNDGVADSAPDNCQLTANPDQSDLDGDNIGDACDADIDNDTVLNGEDNCPANANQDQLDSDFDGFGNACDDDDDGDGVVDGADNCPLDANADQADVDNDGLGDACDEINNNDSDNDGVLDTADNCPLDANPDQLDHDGDGLGDFCDPDADGDGVVNGSDHCPATPFGVIVDTLTGCSIAQLCPCEGPRGTTEPWKNHGQYVSCTAKSSESFVEQGLISAAEKDAIVSQAAQSACGKKQ